jgi:hypothetical protein
MKLEVTLSVGIAGTKSATDRFEMARSWPTGARPRVPPSGRMPALARSVRPAGGERGGDVAPLSHSHSLTLLSSSR